MKKITAVVILLLLSTCSFVFSQEREFYKNIQIISPVVGLNTWTIPVGANFEYGLSKHIGIGGTAMLWWWTSQDWANSLIGLSFDGAYHFTTTHGRTHIREISKEAQALQGYILSRL